jgi:hypothetical protein
MTNDDMTNNAGLDLINIKLMTVAGILVLRRYVTEGHRVLVELAAR